MSPFDLSRAKLTTILHELNGANCIYRDAFSSRNVSSSEHMSFAAGVTVGAKFASVGVHGKYDKSVMDDEDVRKNPSW
jgi:hypothetical protein